MLSITASVSTRKRGVLHQNRDVQLHNNGIKATVKSSVERVFETDVLEASESSTASVRREMPGHLDARSFKLDTSVHRFVRSNTPFGSKKYDILNIASQFAAAAGQDSHAAAYWGYHAARFSFFASQGVAGLLSYAASAQAAQPDGQPGPTASGQEGVARFQNIATPEVAAWFLNEAFITWQQDYAWIKSGVYKMPWDMVTPNKQFDPGFLMDMTFRFMAEGAVTLQRRAREQTEPVWLQSRLYPQYYTKTFHYQSDGWFSDWSAGMYEHSTETLFTGRQDAMQRSALAPIAEYINTSRTPIPSMKLLEVAAGTGRFHTFIKDNWPFLPSICSDLSPFYLQKARDNMKEWKAARLPSMSLGGTDGTGATFMQMAAESLDLADASVDIVVCVYLFHEMPEAVRLKAVAEWFRVLKPGGLCVFTDSCQLGDRPNYDDGMGEFGNFNEPWYVNYINCDFGAMFSEAGFVPKTKYLVSATKTLSFLKPLDA